MFDLYVNGEFVVRAMEYQIVEYLYEIGLACIFNTGYVIEESVEMIPVM